MNYDLLDTLFYNDVATNAYTTARPITMEEIVESAKIILSRRFLSKDECIQGSASAKDFLIVLLSNLTYEVFCVAFLNSQHQVIKFEEMFRGTIDQATIYPREVVKRALDLNAATLILAHNHPTGCTRPSTNDQKITKDLQLALNLFDIEVLDHIIVAGTYAISFVELGLI
jgi:DNA repair protein RadC